MTATSQRWTLTNGRFQVHGHTDFGSQLVEKFPTKELAVRFATRIVASGKFSRCMVRDSMAEKDEPCQWVVDGNQGSHG